MGAQVRAASFGAGLGTIRPSLPPFWHSPPVPIRVTT